MLSNDGLRDNECDILAEDISAYLDGELDKEGSARVGKHLNECEKCAELYRALRVTSREISAASVVIPDSLHSEIMKRVEAEKGSESKKKLTFSAKMRRLGMVCGVGAAAVICLAVLGGPVFRGGMGMDGAMIQKNSSAEAELAAMDGASGISGGYSLDVVAEDNFEDAVMEAPEMSLEREGSVPEERYDMTSSDGEKNALLSPTESESDMMKTEGLGGECKEAKRFSANPLLALYDMTPEELAVAEAEYNNIVILPVNRKVLH